MGRQDTQPIDLPLNMGPGPEMFDNFGLSAPTSDDSPPSPDSNSELPTHSSTMDCDSKSKSHKDGDQANDDQYYSTTSNTKPDPNPTATTTSPGPAPVIARRHFRSPMRRGNNNSPSIFERDDPPTTGASGKPITVGDVFDYYLNHGAAARKRAPRPRTTRNFN
jgi:hypothetical protein